MNEIDSMLEEQIKSLLDELSKLTPGSKEHGDVVHDLNILYKMRDEHYKATADAGVAYDRIDLDKAKLELEKEKLELDRERVIIDADKLNVERDRIDNESERLEFERDKAERESECEMTKVKDARRSKIVDVAVKVGELLFTGAFTAVFINKGFKFEETNVWTSPTMKEIFRGIFKKKR